MYIGPWQEYELARVCKPSLPKHRPPLGASSRNEVVQALEDFLREADQEMGGSGTSSPQTDKTAKLRHILAKLTQPSSARVGEPLKPSKPKLLKAPVAAVPMEKSSHVSAAMQRVARMKEVYTRAARKEKRVGEVHAVREDRAVKEAPETPESFAPGGMSIAQIEELEALHDEGTAGLDALDTSRSERNDGEIQHERRDEDLRQEAMIQEVDIVAEQAGSEEVDEDIDELLKWTQTIDEEIRLLENEQLPGV